MGWSSIFMTREELKNCTNNNLNIVCIVDDMHYVIINPDFVHERTKRPKPPGLGLLNL